MVLKTISFFFQKYEQKYYERMDMITKNEANKNIEKGERKKERERTAATTE